MAKISIPQNFRAKVNRSGKNLSHEKRFSTLVGVNNPVMFTESYPHDFHKLQIDTLLQSTPLQAPLMGTFKLRSIVCFEPYSNLYGWYDNNTRTSTEDLMNKHLHTFTFPRTAVGSNYSPQNESEPDPDQFVTGTPRGGIYDFLGVSPGTVSIDGSPELVINVERVLAYIDFVRTYSVNRQESDAYYIVSGDTTTEPSIATVPLSTLDALFMELRYQKDGVQFGESFNLSPSSYPGLNWFNTYLGACLTSKNSGLFLCLYEPDYYMNFLQNTVGSVKSTVTVGSDNTFSIHELYFRNKIQSVIDSFDLSGGVFTNWARTLWGAKPHGSIDIPDIVGSITTLIDPSNITVVSDTLNATAGTGSSPGELAGNVNQYNGGHYDVKNNRFKFGTQEEGIFFVISQLIPMPDYSQGIDPNLLRVNYMDKYKMQLQRLGFQDVPRSIYTTLPATDSSGKILSPTLTSPAQQLNTVVYKQIAWLDLMTATSRVHGDFAAFGNREYWTLNRRFQHYSTLAGAGNLPSTRISTGQSLSRYVDPRDWQYMFTDTTLNAHNFYVQYGFSFTSIRPVGKRFTPSMN